jgi:hypothetical protein
MKIGNLNINALYTDEMNSCSLTDTITSVTRSTEVNVERINEDKIHIQESSEGIYIN